MNTDLNRRDFLRLSALSGAGLTLAPAWTNPMSSTPAQAARARSTGLTPLALTQDGIALATGASSLSTPFKRSLNAYRDVVFAGGVMRSAETWAPALLNRSRDAWPAWTEAEENVIKTVALVSGWTFHRAAGQVLYPEADATTERTERQLYHDAFVLRQRYAELHDTLPEADPEAVQSLLRDVDARSRIRIHTFEPDAEAVEDWIPKIVAWNESLTEQNRRFAEAYAAPDEALTQRYIEAESFYDPSDDLIRLAAARRHGEDSTIDLEAALTQASDQSRYTQALAQGFNHLTAVAAYCAGELDEAGFKQRLGLA